MRRRRIQKHLLSGWERATTFVRGERRPNTTWWSREEWSTRLYIVNINKEGGFTTWSPETDFHVDRVHFMFCDIGRGGDTERGRELHRELADKIRVCTIGSGPRFVFISRDGMPLSSLCDEDGRVKKRFMGERSARGVRRGSQLGLFVTELPPGIELKVLLLGQCEREWTFRELPDWGNPLPALRSRLRSRWDALKARR